MITEKERKNRDELFKLMQENPELPVVPMVDGEIVVDDWCCRWKGSWGSSYIGEYVEGDERIYFRDDDEIEDVLNHCIGGVDFYELPESEAERAYENLPWVKAIIVDIDLPD